jgi:hypothetical protein
MAGQPPFLCNVCASRGGGKLPKQKTFPELVTLIGDKLVKGAQG